MVQITTLEHTRPEFIYNAFKSAFENYVIPLEFQEETFYRRLREASVDLKLSYGAFEDHKLVAFILQAEAGKILYNFAIGVIPGHRGQKLIEKIYQIIQPSLHGFAEYSLEVIKENLPALSLYQKMDYEIVRELISLKGQLSLPPGNRQYEYQILPLEYLEEMAPLRLARPSLENSWEILNKNPHLHEVHILRKDERLLAYAIFTPQSLSLREIGSAPEEDYLDFLFLKMKLNDEQIRVMNIDSASPLCIEYFRKRGLNVFVSQYEMKKKLTAI